MAYTNLKNVIVEKAFSGGRGFAVSEVFKKQDGTEGKSRWKVWFDDAPGLSEGQAVNVSGIHSDKIVEFEGNDGTVQIVERSINKARLADEQPAQPETAAEPF